MLKQKEVPCRPDYYRGEIKETLDKVMGALESKDIQILEVDGVLRKRTNHHRIGG